MRANPAPPGICNQSGAHSEWYGKIGKDQVEWVRHFLGWDPVDLRDYGSKEWFYTSWKVVVQFLGTDASGISTLTGYLTNLCPNFS